MWLQETRETKLGFKIMDSDRGEVDQDYPGRGRGEMTGGSPDDRLGVMVSRETLVAGAEGVESDSRGCAGRGSCKVPDA